MTTHVEDGALVRYLDDECEAGERPAIASHVGACAACAERLTGLRDRARAVSRALRLADPAAARGRPGARRTATLVAAAVALLAVVGTVRPLRAWIAERAEALWTMVTGRTAPRDAGLAPADADPGAAVVRFVPADGAFTVRLGGRQAGGQLTLEGVPGDTASAAVHGGTGAEDLVILPAGLRIANPPGSAARYVIRVPVRLETVRVMVGDEPVRAFDPGGPPLTVDLRVR